MCKGLVSWWRDRFIYRSKTVPMIVKYWRGHGHVYSTDRKHQLAVEWCHADEGLCMESQHLTSHLCTRKNTGDSGLNYRIQTAHSLRVKWKKMGLLLLTEKLLTHFG